MVWLFYKPFLSIKFCFSILPVELVVLMLLPGFLIPIRLIFSSLKIIYFLLKLIFVSMGMVCILLSAVYVFGWFADSLDPVFQ